jgi:uncharacterized protein
VLVDAHLLLFAVDRRSPFHAASAEWLTAQLNGSRRVGLPWQTLGAFLRISTHARASEHPLTPDEAWRNVREWLACDTAWIPLATDLHGDVLGELVMTYQLRGNLIADAELAALAIEHGLAVYSADTDFARFTEVRWVNPLAPR